MYANQFAISENIPLEKLLQNVNMIKDLTIDIRFI